MGDIRSLIYRIVRDVAELPDRDSPEDQPDMMLVTADELSMLIQSAFDEYRERGGQVGDGPGTVGPWTDLDELHPNTADLVDRFAFALKEKFLAAQLKYGYTDNWLDPNWMDECRAKLMDHVAKGDPRDVANYCAFLWHHGERTAVPDHELIARQPIQPAPEAPNEWRRAVIEQLVITECAYESAHETDPKAAIDALIGYHVARERNPPAATVVPDEVMEAAGDVSFYCRAVEKDDAKLNVQLRKVLAFLQSIQGAGHSTPPTTETEGGAS